MPLLSSCVGTPVSDGSICDAAQGWDNPRSKFGFYRSTLLSGLNNEFPGWVSFICDMVPIWENSESKFGSSRSVSPNIPMPRSVIPTGRLSAFDMHLLLSPRAPLSGSTTTYGASCSRSGERKEGGRTAQPPRSEPRRSGGPQKGMLRLSPAMAETHEKIRAALLV